MRAFTFVSCLGTALAARGWLYAADTGADLRYEELGVGPGELPPLDEIRCLDDFEWAARNVLNSTRHGQHRQRRRIRGLVSPEYGGFPGIRLPAPYHGGH
jgi:hypothetical protein